MKKGKKSAINIKIIVHHKCVKRWLIIVLLCGNLASDSALLRQKPRLGQIANTASQCEAVSSLKDT
jgi:hypothetical protein